MASGLMSSWNTAEIVHIAVIAQLERLYDSMTAPAVDAVNGSPGCFAPAGAVSLGRDDGRTARFYAVADMMQFGQRQWWERGTEPWWCVRPGP